jgi:lysophospholipase L1-like esterase
MEFAVRAFFPQINYQGNQMSLFVENRFYKTMGLAPNSSGEIFGKEVYTDEFGFRQMNSPVNYDNSWLFLGDSVAFGVGLDTGHTFPQLIQNEFQRTKIWNTAIVGYSAMDYLDIVETFLRDHHDIEKVILFFCLNDVYRNLSLNNASVSTKEKTLSFLRSNSKLYLLLKKLLFDRSKTYALHDIGLYEEGNSEIDKHLNAILSIKSTLDKSNIDFMLVILPYEYQLRVRGLKAPQILLNSFFAKHNVRTLDLYEDFTLLNSEKYFLYGDPMHLSSLGHKIVAKKMVEILRKNDPTNSLQEDG